MTDALSSVDQELIFSAAHACHLAGKLKEAEIGYRRLLSVSPQHADALHYLGVLALEVNQLAQAATLIDRALALAPCRPDYWCNRGMIHFTQGSDIEAIACYRRALELRPDFYQAYNNLGLTMMRIGRREEAESCYRRALAINADAFEAKNGLGQLLLQQGRFCEGWEAYESRHENRELAARAAFKSIPRWQGEPLAGCRLLVVGEQGLGDQIQFVRFAAQLHARSVTVDVLAEPSLVDLFTTAPGVGRVVTRTAVRHYDYWIPMLSLPRLFGTDLLSIPSGTPYLFADPARVLDWGARISAIAGRRRKVGLVWAGNPGHLNDRFRSMALTTFAPMLEVGNVQFFSLQKGPAEKQLIDARSAWRLAGLGSGFRDYGDTAAAIENLDLVISADTSVAHLAGALGKPVWLLLHANPDWRWLLDREDSPWYPTMRLFRQRVLGDWTEAVWAVRSALTGWAR